MKVSQVVTLGIADAGSLSMHEHFVLEINERGRAKEAGKSGDGSDDFVRHLTIFAWSRTSEL